MAITLNFEDASPRRDSDAIWTAEYRGFHVKIYRDDSPSNPFEEWDGEPPMVRVLYGHGGRADVEEFGDADLLRPFRQSHVTPRQISRHWRAIAAALNLDADAADREARATQREYGGGLTTIRRDQFEDALEGLHTADQLEAAAKLWRIFGCEALATSSTGYSQSDYAYLLLIATPEWSTRVGAPRDTHARQLAAAAKLYGYWAWGDVYGYVIEDPDGEHVDSCWGFYTDDPTGSGFTDSGMAEHALPALESALRSRDLVEARELELSRPDMYAAAESVS
jgi:hypothetical protein